MRKNLAIALICLGSSTVFAMGYEKPILWSGHYGGIAGAAVSSVQGSQSLLFNPAGLAPDGGAAFEGSVNGSLTLLQTSAPTLFDNASTVGNQMTKFPFALTARYAIEPDLAVGFGFFTAGAAASDFGTTDFSALSTGVSSLSVIHPDYKTDFKFLEFALGAGYRLAPGFKVGASWRLTLVRAEMSIPSIVNLGTSNQVVTGLYYHDLSDVDFTGFRLGAQFAPEGMPLSLGASVRTPVGFKAKGKVSGQVVNGLQTVATTVTESDVTVQNSFPLQIALGASFQILPNELSVFFEYDFTNYAINQALGLTGTVAVPAGVGSAAGTITLYNINQYWKNTHDLRLGFEYAVMEGLKARAGYALSTAPTAKAYARAFFPTPGPLHTFTLGAGHELMSKALSLDGALEYGIASGTVAGVADPLLIKNGSYKTTEWTFHVGGSYSF